MKKPFAAYAGDDPYIFVCYAHDDEGLVYPEIQWLAEQGLNIWYDEGISPGSEWSEELGQAIENAAKFLIFVTPNSVASRHCRNEVHFAQNRYAQVLSVQLVETELPAGLELALGASQGILAHQVSQTEYREKMLRALNAQPVADERPSDLPAKTSGLKRKVFISLTLGVLALCALWLGFDSDDAKPGTIADSTAPSIAPTKDLAALEAYFKGKQLLEIRTSESLISAREKFQEAIDRDPSFAHAHAHAHAGLAEAWLEIPNYTADVDPQAARQGAS